MLGQSGLVLMLSQACVLCRCQFWCCWQAFKPVAGLGSKRIVSELGGCGILLAMGNPPGYVSIYSVS